MNCEQVRAAHLAGEPTRATDAHLVACPDCIEERPELDRLRRLLGDTALWDGPGDDVAEQVAAFAGPVGAAGRRPPARAPGRWAAGAAAVAVVLALVAAVALIGGGTDPDWELVLEPTDIAPGARAVVQGWNEATGTRMELDVDGLPVAGDDEYYAIWLTAADGRHVPAGTFTAPGEVTGWAGVRRDEFPRLWITLEANDDDESLSGVTVLDVPT
jgi:anti-sigma factor RsiW